MKKIITICVGLIVAGYATAAQPDEANAKIQNLEKKLEAADAKIQALEKRLVAIENAEVGTVMPLRRTGRLVEIAEECQKRREKDALIKRLPRSAAVGRGSVFEDIRRQREAAAAAAVKEAEEKKKAVDEKIGTFLQEHFGVQFGDSIDKFPEEFDNRYSDKRVVNVLKKFKYFDKAYGEFYEGKLWVVVFYVDIDEKFSINSTNEKINQAIADLAVDLGLDSSAFNERYSYSYAVGSSSTSYRLGKFFMDNKTCLKDGNMALPSSVRGIRRYEVSFSDVRIVNQILEEKSKAEEEALRKANAIGETLPDPE